MSNYIPYVINENRIASKYKTSNSEFEEDNDEIRLNDIPESQSPVQIVPLGGAGGDAYVHSTPKKKPLELANKVYLSGASGAISPVTSDVMESSLSPLKFTQRKHFMQDDDEEERLETLAAKIPLSPGQIVPIVQDLGTVDIMGSPKTKPFTPTKPSKFKGEVLTPDKVLEFMIKERQAMDVEYASLRKQNNELKTALERRALTPEVSVKQSPPPRTLQLPPGSAQAERAAIEKAKEEKKWRDATERVQQENELLKKQLKENEEKMRLHYEHLLQKVTAEARLKEQALLRDQDELREREEADAAVAIKPKASPEVPPLVFQQARVEPPARRSLRSTFDSTDDDRGDHSATLPGPRLEGNAGAIVEIRRCLWEGMHLWKVPFNSGGFPERRAVQVRREGRSGSHARRVRVVNDEGTMEIKHPDNNKPIFISYPLTILWYAPGKSSDPNAIRELVLNRDAHVIPGHGTPAFWKLVNNGQAVPNADCCFSIVSHTRTLDFVADSPQQAQFWVDGIDCILSVFNGNPPSSARQKKFSFRGQEVESSYAPQHHALQSNIEFRKMELESAKKQMFMAAIAGDYDLLRDILEAGVSVNLMEPARSDTPLMIACRAGNNDIVKLCLHFGAKNDPHPDFGHTALHVAVLSAQQGAASILLEAAAASEADSTIANLADPSGQTPLHIASEKGLMSMIEMLLSHGAEIGRRDGSGRTPIHISASLGQKKCLAVLLDHSGDAYLEETDNFGCTALHYASDNGHLACVRLLLETAAEVNCRNAAGKTPYMLANSRGHYQVAQLLLEYQQALNQARGTPVAESNYNAGYSPMSNHSWANSPMAPNDRYGAPPKQSSSPIEFKQHFMKPQRPNDETLPRPHTAGSPRPNNSLSQSFPSGSNSASKSNSRYFAEEITEQQQGSMNRISSQSIGGQSYNAAVFATRTHNNYAQPSYDNNDVYDSATYIQLGSSYSPQQPSHWNAKEAWSPVNGGGAAENATALNTAEAYDATEDYVPPHEQFYLDDLEWSVYSTEDGHIYYLNVDGHSQWGDPRVYGVYNEGTADAEDEKMPSPTKPPKSPRSSPSDFSHVSLERAREKLAQRALSDDSFDSDAAEDIIVRMPIKEHHATYKTPRKELFERKPPVYIEESKGELPESELDGAESKGREDAENKTREEDEPVSPTKSSAGPKDALKLSLLKKMLVEIDSPQKGFKNASSPKNAISHHDLEGRLNRYLSIIESGESMRDVRRLMEEEGESKELIAKVISLLDEIELRNELDDSFSPSCEDSCVSKSESTSPDSVVKAAFIPEERLVNNLWKMGKFNSVSATESKASTAEEFTSPRRKLILYNVLIGLSQLKSLGNMDTILDAVCSLDTMRGRITGEHLDSLLQLLPSMEDLNINSKKPLAGHPAEDFLDLATKYYPDLPQRVYACLICSQFMKEYNFLKANCKTLVDGCNQILSSDKLAVFLDESLQAKHFSVDELSGLTTSIETHKDNASGKLFQMVEDLSLMEPCSLISAAEILAKMESLNSQVHFLEAEQSKCTLPSSSTISEKVTNKYVTNLSKYLDSYNELASDLMLQRKLLKRKVDEVCDYFNESSSDPSAIFQTLHSLNVAVIDAATNKLDHLFHK